MKIKLKRKALGIFSSLEFFIYNQENESTIYLFFLFNAIKILSLEKLDMSLIYFLGVVIPFLVGKIKSIILSSDLFLIYVKPDYYKDKNILATFLHI